MQKILNLSAYIPAILFPISAFIIGLRNAGIFQTPQLIEETSFPILLFLLIIFITIVIKYKKAEPQEELLGILLFTSFTIGYFLLASIFNRPDVNTNNIYFAADNWSWYLRMADESGWDVGTRAIHPYTHLIFRPVIFVLSLTTNRDRFYAMLILLASTGGGCVWLTWKILKEIYQDKVFPILFSSVLGLSASHLIFASVIETYIFSTFCLLVFIWLVLKNKPYSVLVIAGVFTFGITVTNLIQEGIITLIAKRNLKITVVTFFCIAIIGALLNFTSRSLYPVTELLIHPENLVGEERFAQEITGKRVVLMMENLFIYNVVAPQPYLSMRNNMPRFNFLNGSIKQYPWFGIPSVLMWVFLLGLSMFYFVKNFQSGSREILLSWSLIICVLFNFILQIGYGIEPFLYSTGWTYAVLIFTFLNLKRFENKNWLKIITFIFGLFLFLNNLWLLYYIARQVSNHLA